MLQINGLNVNLDGKQIITDLTATFAEGTLCSIVGANGSGKTTLLRAIEGLVPSTGEMLVDGKDLRAMDFRAKARLLAFLPQNRPVPNIRGELMIQHGRFPHLGFSKTLSQADRLAVEEAVKQTGTQHLLSKRLTSMSGGEQQRVYLACALAQQTDILLLDEPTAHLDLPAQLDTLRLIRSLLSAGKTITLVLHDLLQAFTFSDYIYLMSEGKLVASGTPQELASSPAIADVFGVNILPDTDESSLYTYKFSNR